MAGPQINSNHHNEAVDLFSGTTVASVLYTLVVVLYCFSSSLTYSQIKNLHGKIQRGTVFTFILATLMMIFATMDVTLLNLQRRITYVDYGHLPGGPLALAASQHASTIIKLSLVTRLVEKLLIIAVMIWRVFVLWTGVPLIKPAILLIYVANAAISIADLVLQWPGTGKLITIVPAPVAEHKMFLVATTFGTAFLAFLTLMLVVRLLTARWQLVKVMGKTEAADTYLGVVAILVESYALETVWNIMFSIFCSLKLVPVKNFFVATVTQIDILTNLLVIYRVVSGRAWDRQTHGHVSTLQWNHQGATREATESIDQ